MFVFCSFFAGDSLFIVPFITKHRSDDSVLYLPDILHNYHFFLYLFIIAYFYAIILG